MTEENQTFQLFREKMEREGCSPLSIAQFEYYYHQLLKGETGTIPESSIEPLAEAADLETLGDFLESGKEALDHTCVIKLNGGLGTSMGLDRAKSLLEVKQGLSFLDIIVRQVLSLRERYSCTVPLVFMNSFRTELDTLSVVRAYPEFEAGQDGAACSFLQNKVPKILQTDYTPATWPKDPTLEWCPPGHGDIYTALSQSGILQILHDEGYRYLFISNSDNLGAVLDLHVLGYFASRNVPFMMEVADRTEADRKGGHLARLRSDDRDKEARLVLRESAQCLDEEQSAFQNIARYRYFNTNSLWLSVEALREQMEAGSGYLHLPLIRNSKTIDPTDKTSPKVYQLETAMGAAIGQFPGAEVLRVPRSRFAPVKKTSDLLALRSDAFELKDDFRLELCAARDHQPPILDLDERFYGHVGDFDERFLGEIPSLQHCTSLRIRGDVHFESGVVLRGDVSIENTSSEPKTIPAGTILSGDVTLP